MANFWKHLRLITKHRHRVIANGAKCGIFWHCLKHDLSKYGPTEFLASKKYYTGTHSPVYEQRMAEDYFSSICQHHAGRNPHHWEYWTDFYKGHLIVKTMPWIYATEYVCDMLSASYCYNPKGFTKECTLTYFLARKDHYYLTKASETYIQWCLERFRDYGFSGLKKKDTKAKYAEIVACYPDTETRSDLHPIGELPSLEKTGIMQQPHKEEKP